MKDNILKKRKHICFREGSNKVKCIVNVKKLYSFTINLRTLKDKNIVGR